MRTKPGGDVVRKRKTEVDQIPGAVAAKAAHAGVAVPFHDEVIREIKELEEGQRQQGWHNIEELADVGRRPAPRWRIPPE